MIKGWIEVKSHTDLPEGESLYGTVDFNMNDQLEPFYFKGNKESARYRLAKGYPLRYLDETPIEPDSHCHCTPDQTTGWTEVKCCNVCGKPVEEFWKPISVEPDSLQSENNRLRQAIKFAILNFGSVPVLAELQKALGESTSNPTGEPVKE